MRWYAIAVKPRYEKAVDRHVRALGYETFLPLYRVRRQWSDRVKDLEAPLFAGYVLANFRWADRVPILRVPGVRSLVTVENRPAPIAAEEIAALKQMVESDVGIRPWPFPKVGQRVRVVRGPLQGVEGILLEVRKTWQVVVNVQILRRSVAAEIDRDAVVRLPS